MDKRADGYLLGNPKQDSIDHTNTHIDAAIDSSPSIAYFSGYVDFLEL